MQAKSDDDDLCGDQRSAEVKYSRLCSMATKHGQKYPWCKFKRMMTFMEVKGQQRSNIVNNALWLPNVVKGIADASSEWQWPTWWSKVNRGQIYSKLLHSYQTLPEDYWWWWYLHRGQRSTEGRCGKLCSLAAIFGQKYRSYKVRMMLTFMEVTYRHKGWSTRRFRPESISNMLPWYSI